MSFYNRIKALGLEDDTNVNLVLEEGCDVHHYTDDFLSNAMAITGIAHTLPRLLRKARYTSPDPTSYKRCEMKACLMIMSEEARTLLALLPR